MQFQRGNAFGIWRNTLVVSQDRCSRGKVIRRSNLACCYLCISLFFILICIPAFAGIEVSSLIIDLEIYADKSYTDSFYVTNNGEEPEKVIVTLFDWNRNLNGKNEVFKARTLPRSLANYIDFSPIEFELKGGETKEVKFTITVPKEEKGTHWAMFLVKTEPRLVKEKKGQFIIKASIGYGIKIYQTDPRTAAKNGRIANVDIIQSNLGENNLIEVKLEFENTGNTHLEPEGQVEIRNEKGETVATVDVKRFPILPGAKRILEIPFKEKNLQSGRYLALVVLDFGGSYLVAGQRVFEIRKD